MPSSAGSKEMNCTTKTATGKIAGAELDNAPRSRRAMATLDTTATKGKNKKKVQRR